MTTTQFVPITAGAAFADYSTAAVIETVAGNPAWAGVARYTQPISPHAQKWLTPAERDRLHRARKAIILVYESFQTRPLAGYAAGFADAGAAQIFAIGIDYPEGAALLFAVDMNAIAAVARLTPGNLVTIASYLNGCADGLAVSDYYRPGIYGDYDAIDVFADRSALNWQMGARSFSHDLIHPAAHLIQYPENWHGHPGLGDQYAGPHSTPGIDSNVCLRWFNAWLPTTTTPEEPDMYLATLNDGNVVAVGSSVRPVSTGEIEPGGPLADLPRVAPPAGSDWHAWLAAGAAEYSHRVMGPPASSPDAAAIATAVYDRLAAAKINSVGQLT